MQKYRKRALDILQTNITTEEAPPLLLEWVETGNQNCILSYEEEGQLLVEIAEALEEAAREERALREADVSRMRAEAQAMRDRIAQLREALEDIREWANQDDVLTFSDVDILLSDFCDRVLRGEKRCNHQK